MPTVRDQAVCLRLWDWSETSQTVSLFGRTLGVLRGVAKGAKREGAAFSGGLEILTRGEVVAVLKANERSPDTLATLTAWDLQETFPAARRSLPAFHAAMYMLDVVHHAVHDSDPHTKLFDGMLDSVRLLERPASDQFALAWFQWLALTECGFAPDLVNDAATRQPLEPAANYCFVPALGGLVGSDTRQAYGEHHAALAGNHAQVWRVRDETVQFLRAVSQAQSQCLPSSAAFHASPDTAPGKAIVPRANRLLASYFQTVLGRWPPSANSTFPGIAGNDSRRRV